MILREAGDSSNGFKGEFLVEVTFDIINGQIDPGPVLLGCFFPAGVFC